MALIIPGGYCSHVTLRSWHVWGLGTSHHNNRISNSPPRQRKDGLPSCQVQLEVGRIKRRVAHSGNLHKCSSCCKFVSGDLGTWVPRVSVNGQPIPFPAPLVGSCHKVSGRLCSSCKDISQQGPQTSLARELVTGDPMACSIPGCPRKRPSGIIAHHQFWQLLPGLGTWPC